MAPNKPQNSPVEVVTDFKAIKDEIGLDVEENSLYLALSLDACKDVSPTLVKTPDGKYYLIVKEIERGTFAGNGRAASAVTSHQINMIYYGSYFTQEAIQKAVAPGAPTPAKALAKVILVDAVTVNRDMPLDKYRGFKDQFRVTLKPDGKEAAKAFVYEVDKKEVTATYNKGRALAEKAAIEITNRATVSNEDKALIKENIARYQGDTFPVLDKLKDL